ncbi:MAG: glycosyl hydrolase [Verrucomicrobia bacterium]|nr:glycosyl hydrolase [Verrucomicrobiota bacterium]
MKTRATRLEIGDETPATVVPELRKSTEGGGRRGSCLRRHSLRFLVGPLLGGLMASLAVAAPAATELADGFATPPDSARPWVYWYFMDGNLTREGLTADLEAMRAAGIGGAIFLEVNIGIPRGPVEFMSPAWRELFGHAVREADRLGIEIALGTGPGWCGTGGPWVKPEQSMQHLVASETTVTGPQRFAGPLPRPAPRTPFFGERTLTPELARLWKEYYRDVAVLAFRKPLGGHRLADVDEKALYLRAPYSSQPRVKPFLPAPARHEEVPSGEVIARDGIVDLTARLSADGRLEWEVPAGEWTILRFGRTATGQTTRPAPNPGLGFESDKFEPAALDAHLEQFAGKLIQEIGPSRRPGRGLTTLHFDSWEMSAQNWSENFRSEFQRRRGYDPLPWLPAMTGRIVGGVETSERFLWDLRQTAQELVLAHHVGRLRDFAHRHGLKFSSEPYDMNPGADLSLGAVADVPMCEFWWKGFDTAYSVIEAASIAHTLGREVVAAEAFTSNPGEDWRAFPGNMKTLGDWAFAAGVNRIAFHRFQHQPWPGRRPGMTMGSYGVHWEHTQTWWPFVPAYHRYLARCQWLLRQGRPVADILYLAAEGAPLIFRPPPSATRGVWPDRLGYNFDGCAPETLLEQAQVRDGRLLLAGGMSYRVLVLPERDTMTPALLRKVGELVRAGATVIGPRPAKSPGLQGYPQCDAEVQRLAEEIWGPCDGGNVKARELGRGRIVWDATVPVERGREPVQYGDYAIAAAELARQGVVPDFESNGPLRYTHRQVGETEVYFVANREARVVDVHAVFRVAGRAPELWDPDTGARRPLPVFSEKGGRTTVPLRFEPEQSCFVVFAPPEPGRTVPAGEGNFAAFQERQTLPGPWQVQFEVQAGGPDQPLAWTRLEDWSRLEDPRVRHYSGLATYRTRFEVADGAAALWLDLGRVEVMARVQLNGRDLGVRWCAPWRVDLSPALRPGANELEITVANLWPNRLIGDVALPVEQRRSWTTRNPFKADTPLLPSGLLGPVRLMIASPATP